MKACNSFIGHIKHDIRDVGSAQLHAVQLDRLGDLVWLEVETKAS